MPSSAVELCRAIESGQASTAQLERIILSDPSVTAGVLRAANSAFYGGTTRQSASIRGAILTLGENSVRSIAVSVWLQALVSSRRASPTFDARAFGDHSLFVGYMSRLFLARIVRQGSGASRWTPDELFAAGVLHDLGLGLLAIAEPRLYAHLHALAHRRLLTHADAFLELYGEPLSTLSLAVASAWKLPTPIPEVLAGYEQPLKAESECDALACVHYADHLAQQAGYSLCPWKVEVWLHPSVADLMALSEEDVQNILEMAEHLTAESVRAA